MKLRLRSWSKRAALLLVITALPVGAVASVLYACTPDEHRRSTPGTVAAGRCTAPPGEFPGRECSTSDDNCAPSTTGTCTIDEAKCGSKSTCMPLTSNTNKTGTTLDFRLRRLNVIAPPSLVYGNNPVLQTTIINDSVSLKEKSCGELGKGTFSLLLQIDKAKNTITAGGAPPPKDAFGTGYCFFRNVVNGLNIQPTTVPVTVTNGVYESSALPKLLIPIFLDETGTSVIVLPLTNGFLKDMVISEDGNCIGSFNPDALNQDCYDDYSTCSKWKTGGALGGLITLEEADAVFIKELNSTLCVLLTGTAPAPKCARDSANKISLKGDYCSNPLGPGGCLDSFWLAATFAASAVKINDGTATPTCSGVPLPSSDAGAEGGPAADAGDAAAPGDAAHD